MSKINRKQRKQLARDIAKITGKKITFTLRAFVTPMVQDRKPAMRTCVAVLKPYKPVYFEPVASDVDYQEGCQK